MILLARALVRLLSFVLLLALAAAGLLAAVFSIGTGTEGPSYGGLADLLNLDGLRDTVGTWLDRLEAPGSVAIVAGLAALGAIALGVLLVAGVLVPRRERLVTLDDTGPGGLAARRPALAQVAQALAEQVRGITRADVEVRPRRRGGGKLSVVAQRPRSVDETEITGEVTEQLRQVTDPFRLDARVQAPVAGRGARVQ